LLIHVGNAKIIEAGSLGRVARVVLRDGGDESQRENSENDEDEDTSRFNLEEYASCDAFID